eukprot:gb/GECG01010907.1/.p1 GENE.gb/GECG01010907.1/~~gb/GECG01010907.1/.p1  ORF type:complete len:294 (+),score=28.11 gb/GECG01010907.1/:1-882(+)
MEEQRLEENATDAGTSQQYTQPLNRDTWRRGRRRSSQGRVNDPKKPHSKGQYFIRKPKTFRRALLHVPQNYPVGALHVAAAFIQAQWRKVLAQKELQKALGQDPNSKLRNSLYFLRETLGKDPNELKFHQEDETKGETEDVSEDPNGGGLKAMGKLISKYHQRVEPILSERCRVLFCDLNAKSADEFAEWLRFGYTSVIGRYERFALWCAHRIVAWWRMLKKRRWYFIYHLTDRFVVYHIAATEICRTLDGYFKARYGRHWLRLRTKGGPTRRNWLAVDFFCMEHPKCLDRGK